MDAFIGLGSNLGDRMAHLGDALRAIGALDDTHVLAVSRVVESEPWGEPDQPRFANAVARIATGIPADRLLGALKDIEQAMGRRPGPVNGPRIIDLDILLYEDEEWASADLVVPHPRMAERDFVITPLLDLAPHVTWPDGTPVTRERATGGRVVGTLGRVPGFEDLTLGSGRAHAHEPGETEGWETVASAHFGIGRGMEFTTELVFDAAMLEEAGIPIGWDPVPPGEEINLWLVPRTYRLLVPGSFAERAREVLADAHASGAVFEAASTDGYIPAAGEPRDPSGDGAR